MAAKARNMFTCNSPNNFYGLSLDKTDHVVQNRTIVIRRYPQSDLISVVRFYLDRRKTKKRASVQAKFQSVMENNKNTFAEANDGEIKRLVDNSVQRKTKNPQNMQERSTCVRPVKLFGEL